MTVMAHEESRSSDEEVDGGSEEEVAKSTGRFRAGMRRVTDVLWAAHRLFWAFRRTRPFWGAVWMILAGAEIIYWSNNSIIIVLNDGWSAGAGYVLGGILILFAVVALVSPMYANLMGMFGVIVALVAFPMTNLGGYILGSVLGIIGGAMVWSWGEKKPKRPKGSRGRRNRTTSESDADSEMALDEETAGESNG